MSIKKLVPWNWFKDEQEASRAGNSLPISRPAHQLHSQLARFHDDMDRLFDNAFRNFRMPSIGLEGLAGFGQNVTLLPNVDIAATEKEYLLTIEVPGVDEKDVRLELVGGTLTIKAEKRQESELKEKDFYRVECAYGSFQRTLTVPDDADPENVEASFKNGVLTVRLPRKALAVPKGKLIEIKTTA